MRLIPQTLIPAFLRPANPPQAVALFEAAMARSRAPVLYAELGLPDTMQGRMEALMLQLAALHRRLARAGPHGPALWQDTLDYAMSEIERAMREVGVGDVTVPKRMRRVAEAFYGRAKAYGAALDAGDRAALAAALVRNAYADAPPDPATVGRLADDLVAVAAALGAQDDAALLRGRVRLPEPAAEPTMPAPATP